MPHAVLRQAQDRMGQFVFTRFQTGFFMPAEIDFYYIICYN